MRDNDRRGYTNIMAHAMGGAWTDDDTDVEFVTLHAVEKYGLNINYEQITQMWKNILIDSFLLPIEEQGP